MVLVGGPRLTPYLGGPNLVGGTSDPATYHAPPKFFHRQGGGIWGGQGFPHAKLRQRRNFGDFVLENAEIFAAGTLFLPLVT